MTHPGGSHDADMRRHVLDAALAVLATTTVSSFSLVAVARRARVEVDVVKGMWANTHALIGAALMEYAARHLPMPDTGSLRGDLVGYAKSLAAAVNSPTGRRLLDAIIATPKDWDVSGWRASFFEGRRRRAAPVLQRAIDRGECPPDVNRLLFMDVLTSGLISSLQFYDRPVTDADCEAVVDLLLNGILLNR